MDYGQYYTYLISLIDPPAGVPSRLREHGMLLFELWKREFFWLDSYEDEENRAHDGKSLREQFMMDYDMSPLAVPQGPANVLEVLVALSLKLDAIVHDWRIGKRPWEWMVMFIENLGLDRLTDDDIYPARDNPYLVRRLETWLSHDISPHGEGGLFRYKRPVMNIRQLSNWDQMNAWVVENF